MCSCTRGFEIDALYLDNKKLTAAAAAAAAMTPAVNQNMTNISVTFILIRVK